MAASSALAKMMIRLAQVYGLETLNIVRKDDHILDLKNNYGANYVFNSESSSFLDELKEAIEKTQPTVIFECVGGDLAGQILNLMPEKSTMAIYGNLSKQQATYKKEDFLKAGKNIHGWLVLFNWLSSLPFAERAKWFKLVADDL